MAAINPPNELGVFVAIGVGQRTKWLRSSSRSSSALRVLATAARPPARPARTTRAVAERERQALSAIDQSPGMRIKGLANALGVPQPTAGQIVKSLSRLQLIAVERDGHDRRAVRIHINEGGRAMLRRRSAQPDFGDPPPEGLTQLDAARLFQVESGLTSQVKALDRSVSPAEVHRRGQMGTRRKPLPAALEC